MKLKSYFLIIIFSVQGLGCKKFVEIDAPKNLVVTEKVFKSNDAAISAVLNIYIAMSNQTATSFYTGMLLGLAADEFTNYSTSSGIVNYYTNSYNSNDGAVLNFWQFGYNLIYQANAVYEGCKQSEALDIGIKKQLMAEALFIRAYWHFYLVNLYGDIPVITTTDYETNRLLPRRPVGEVYTSIINDLKFAVANLSENYLEGDTKTISSERIRPNKYVASALLARVYLYDKQYALAASESSLVINQGKYKLSTLNTAFLRKSAECIWQLQTPLPSAATLNSFEAFNFILTAKPTANTVRCVTVSDDLYASFELNDQRKNTWIGSFNESASIIYRYPAKYKSRSTTIAEEYSTLLRVGELFLIRAEARANLDDLDGSKADLNAIRARAGLGNTTATDKQALLNAILKERRVELFSEFGHRWFDLKRLGEIDEVMGLYAQSKGSTWSAFKKLLPIPINDIENGPLLNQNDGYN